MGKHTMAGLYLGNAWEHYCCHEIWTIDTRSIQVRQTEFFKHKYLVDPILMESDALLHSSSKLCAALKGSSGNING